MSFFTKIIIFIFFWTLDIILIITHKSYYQDFLKVLKGKKIFDELKIDNSEKFKGYSGSVMIIIITIMALYSTLKILYLWLKK